MPDTPAGTQTETVGLINGLAEVVKQQQQSHQTVIQKTSKQLQQLAITVETLSKSISTKPSTQAFRLPNVVLPEFTGKENLDNFLEQTQNLLSSSGVPPKHSVTYLKQQVYKDSGAYDALTEAEIHMQAFWALMMNFEPFGP